MNYSKKELRSISQEYPFLFDSLFLEKNHHVLRSVVKNLESSQGNRIGIRMKDGQIAFRCGEPSKQTRHTASQIRHPEADAATELLLIDALRIFSLDSEEREQRKRAVEVAKLYL